MRGGCVAKWRRHLRGWVASGGDTEGVLVTSGGDTAGRRGLGGGGGGGGGGGVRSGGGGVNGL